MPNYGLVINSKFRPFSYQEMLAPVMRATQAHQALEDAYGNIESQVDAWKKIVDEEPDSRATKIYKEYVNSLENAANELAKNGLGPNSKQSLWNMTKRYASEINPISEAYKRKQTLADEQRKAGDRYIYDFDAATESIDKFLDNSNLNYRSIDKLQLLQKAQNAYKQFADRISDNGFRYDSEKLDRFHKTLIKEYGFAPEEASSFINQISQGNMTNNEAVNIIANNLFNSTGVAEWKNALANNQVWNTIAEGISAGIGKSDKAPVTDEEALARFKASLTKQSTPPKKDKIPRLSIVPRFTIGGDTPRNSLLNDDLSINEEKAMKAYELAMRVIREEDEAKDKESTIRAMKRAKVSASTINPHVGMYTASIPKYNDKQIAMVNDYLELVDLINSSPHTDGAFGDTATRELALQQALQDKYATPVSKDVDIEMRYSSDKERKSLRSWFQVRHTSKDPVKAVKYKDGKYVDSKDIIDVNDKDTALIGTRQSGDQVLMIWETKDGIKYSKSPYMSTSMLKNIRDLNSYRDEYEKLTVGDATEYVNQLYANYKVNNPKSKLSTEDYYTFLLSDLKNHIIGAAYDIQKEMSEWAADNDVEDSEW